MAQQSVLFVDDESSILNALKRLFRKSPYRVLTAQGGKEALTLIDSGETPAVIVSDQRMPGMNGAEFLTQAKEKLPDSVRIMLTGYSEVDAAMDAINKGGIYRYVTKPWEDDDLKLTVQDAIDRYELVAQNRALTEELKIKNVELEQFNATLEEMVEKRTQALKKTYEQLQKKLKELEGRDRIQQHLLEIHALDETLQVVLEVIVDVLGVDAAVIHLVEGDNLIPVAALGTADGDGAVPEHRLQELSDRPVHREILAKVLNNGEPARIKARRVKFAGETIHIAPFGVAPIILNNGERLGAVEIDRRKTKAIIRESELKTVLSFGMQAAVAIRDSQLKDDLPSLESSIDDVLKNFQS